MVFWFFFGSYYLIATVLNRVTKKINRSQSGSSHPGALRRNVDGTKL
jgi:hypothetical protein